MELAPLPSPGFYSQLFVVMKASGSWRPVIDLSLLNLKVLKTSFKMETLQSVLLLVQKGNWMVSLDLKDAYLQVPIHLNSRKYLRFVAFGRVYQSKALCFGLHDSSGFHKGGHSHSVLPGRLVDPGIFPFPGSSGAGCGSLLMPQSRNCRQLGEVSSGAFAKDDLS